MRELGLLALVIAAFAVGWAGESFAIAGKATADWWLTPLEFGVLLLATHVVLNLGRFNGDQSLLPMVGLLSGIGLLVLNYLEPAQERAQFGWLALGLGFMLATIFGLRNIAILQRYKYTAAALGIVLLIITAVFGREINGARLWLGIGPAQFQPSELMKLLLVIFMAAYLDERREILSRADYRWATLKLSPLPYLCPYCCCGACRSCC